MRLRVTVFGTLGVSLTAFGIALLAAPGTLRRVGAVDQMVTIVATLPATMVMFATGSLAAGYIVLAARSPGRPTTDRSPETATERFETLGESPPEAVTAERQTITAADVDEKIDSAVAGSEYALMQVRSTLRALAARSVDDASGGPTDEGIRAVEDGRWTSDPVAAGFLATPDGPAPPVRSRLRLWLTPERERRRRIERTLAVIEEEMES